MPPEVNPLVPEIAVPVLSSLVTLKFPLFVIHTIQSHPQRLSLVRLDRRRK